MTGGSSGGRVQGDVLSEPFELSDEVSDVSFGGAAFAGGAVVAGALAGPAGEVAIGGEAAHVGADLGDHRFGGASLHAGDRAEQLNRGGERGELRLDLVGEQLDLLVEEVEVSED